MNVSLLNLHRHFVARDSRHKEEVRNLKSVFPEGCFGRMAFNDPLPLNLYFFYLLLELSQALHRFSSLHSTSICPRLFPSHHLI